MLEALHAIPDEQARAVMAFTLDGHPDSAIAAHLYIDPQKVRNLRAKARALLRVYLTSSHRRKEGRPDDAPRTRR
ncbi:hypothetical protein [Actinomadura sp. 9N215]|uniref:hypothetical protein n=1 Tax=Actinomadura sp. 9N215 TaxID=3375150 RepID=UPI003791F0D1